jgi:hypothetical protein
VRYSCKECGGENTKGKKRRPAREARAEGSGQEGQSGQRPPALLAPPQKRQARGQLSTLAPNPNPGC